MNDFQFKKVTLDVAGDPLRADFTWWGDLDDAVHTRFAIWIKSAPDVDQNALLAVHVGPDADHSEMPYRLDLGTKGKVEGGSVVELARGRLVVDFPRALLRGYGPGVQWWALASLGLVGAPLDEAGDDLDFCSDPDASTFDTSTWFS